MVARLIFGCLLFSTVAIAYAQPGLPPQSEFPAGSLCNPCVDPPIPERAVPDLMPGETQLIDRDEFQQLMRPTSIFRQAPIYDPRIIDELAGSLRRVLEAESDPDTRAQLEEMLKALSERTNPDEEDAEDTAAGP